MYFKTETFVGAFILLALGLFVYMSFQLGSVRLNLARYATYFIGFKDVSSLLPKSDIRIAGVKVGWVDSVDLDPEDMHVKVIVKVQKEFHLSKDTAAIVRQEGLLGVKYLEIVPGNLETGIIEPDGSFPFQDKPAIGIDEIFTSVTTLAKQIERLGTSLEEATAEAREILQSVGERVTKIDKVFTDLGKASESFQETAQIVKRAGTQVNELLGTAEAPVKKLTAQLSNGEGSIGKLLGDDQLYYDIKTTSEYARSCVEAVKDYCVGIDSHLEVLPNSFRDRFFFQDKKTDVKWYFDGYLASTSGLFGKLGLTYSHKGFAKHRGDFCSDDRLPFVRGHRNGIRLNLQVGKYVRPYAAIRVGVFEGSAGVGLDWWMAFNRFRWLTTFEAFDFKGFSRFNFDRRPHLKWLNRVFFTNNVYLSFGADDFISKCNKSGFVGVGAYFSVPDLFSGCY